MSKEANYKFNKFAMDLGRVVLSPLILWFRAKKIYLPGAFSGEEEKKLGGALIAANHVGMSDPFILNAAFWYRRFFYTTSEEVMTGLRGKLLEKAGCVRIDRTTADLKAIKKCTAILKDGYLLGMFPQGHIGGDGARGGAVLIAAMAKVPMVTVYIEKRKHFWQRQKLVYGGVIDVPAICKKSLPDKQETEELLAKMDENNNRCREYLASLK